METRAQHMHTLDIVPLLDRGQQLELLQNVDSVVEDIQHNWNEDAKTDSPSGTSCTTSIWAMSMTATRQAKVSRLYAEEDVSRGRCTQRKMSTKHTQRESTAS